MRIHSKLYFFLLPVLCGCVTYHDQLADKSPDQIRAMSDLQLCIAHEYGINDLPLITAEFNQRGLICDSSGPLIKVSGYTQERFNDADDATCLNYGFKEKSAGYANCRMQLNAQRQNAALVQQAIQAQQDATSAATNQNLLNQSLRLMEQSAPTRPSITSCNQTAMGVNCIGR